MANKKIGAALTMVLIGLAPGVFAQSGSLIRPAYQYPPLDDGANAASVQLGDSPLYATPYLGFAAGRDDNVLLTNTNEVVSNLYVTSPGLKIDARSVNQVFQATYTAHIGRYTDSEPDNYIDHFTHLQYDVAFDRRNFMKLGFDYTRGHDPRGSTDRGIPSTPDKYRLSSTYGTYAFGAPGANGRLEAYASRADKVYLNNRAATAASDRKTEEYGGIFYWRAMPKTYLLAEARATYISYKQTGSTLSADERRYYGGVSWEATAATTGTIKLGRLERRPDAASVPKFSGNSWEAIVSWAPRTYSKFDFYTGRQTNEPSGLGDFILSDISGVAWNHSWSSVLTTAVDFRFQKDEYQGFDRSDDVKVLGFKVGYRFRRWLTLGAEYTHTRRDSNGTQYEYDRNLYLLTATASL